MKNKLFRPDFNSPDQNAIVSGDWLDRPYAYREGFMQATLALLAVANAEGYDDPNTGETSLIYVDALVYPICFNARHFLELFLKDSIRAVSALGKKPTKVDVIATHDLSSLWARFVDVIKRDVRLVKRGTPLEDVLKDVASIDNTSMAFRYSHDLDENEHLSGLEHINLTVLGNRFREMFKQAEDFSTCLAVLQREYAQSTFTGKLHREDLNTIARRLPPYENWAEELPPIKQEICNQMNLSSNDFGKALTLIKQHREFAIHIGIELPLEGLPIDIFTRLAAVHAEDASHDVITMDEWLRLAAVMEISMVDSYSEEYDDYLKYISGPKYEGLLEASHIARNAYARNQRLSRGLAKLGQKTLLAALAEAIPHLTNPLPRRRTPEEISNLLAKAVAPLKGVR